MGGRIIAGVIGFVVLVLLIQTYVLGGDDDDGGAGGRTGAAPTATLPAQTPEAISLGAVEPAGSGAGGQTASSTTYIVKEGDTLGTIATSFNVPAESQAAWISEVLDLNAIADARLLQAGQELQIPAAPAAPGTTPGVPGIATATPTPEGAAGGAAAGTYIIESGDTPFGIAEKLCVESPATWVNELVALNGINPNNLSVGQELELPAGTPANCP